MLQAMIVDDEPRMRKAFLEEVDWKRCGVRKVWELYRIKDAIDLVQKEKIDILVCDIEMPGGSGLRLLEWLRDHEYRLACIFVTCHPEFDYMRRAIQLNCYDYILKPVDFEEFSRILTDMVEKLEGSASAESEKSGGSGDGKRNLRVLEWQRESRSIEQEVKQYIKKHLQEEINIYEMGEELHFNSQHLSRVFKSKTGYGIAEYITVMRMNEAKRILVETTIPIKDVAGMVGYRDYNYFTRVFKKEFDLSPREYRQLRGRINLLESEY